MAFSASSLPPKVHEAFRLGALGWPLAVQETVKAGIRGPDEVTDIVSHDATPSVPPVRGRRQMFAVKFFGMIRRSGSRG